MKKITVFSLLLIILDQLLKYLVDVNILLNDSITIIHSFFDLTYVRNFGAAFSILNGNRIFFIVIALFSVVLIYTVFIQNKQIKKLEIITYSLLLSGIVGNVLDRIFRGYVIDYLDFHIGIYHFPIFNLADICIVLATVLILYMIIKEERHGKHKGE